LLALEEHLQNLKSNTQELGNARVEAVSVVLPWVLSVKHSEGESILRRGFLPEACGRAGVRPVRAQLGEDLRSALMGADEEHDACKD